MRRPAAIAELLPRVTQGKEVGRRLEEAKIWRLWDDAVGEVVAANARPLAFRDGTLTVAVTSAPWMQQLTFLKPQLVSSLNARLGSDLVRDIYLKAGRPPRTETSLPPARRPTRTLSTAEHEEIARQSMAAGDPELASLVANLMATHRVHQDNEN